MKKKVLILMVLACFLTGIVNMLELAAQTKDAKSFKKESEPDIRIKSDMLKSREYRQILKDVKASGRKGLAAGEGLRVYIKEANASEISVNEKSRGGTIPRQIRVGAILIDSGGDIGTEASPVGIIMVGDGKNFRGLKLTAEIKDGKPVASLVDVKGKPVHEAPLEIMEKSHLKVRPNGTTIASEKDEVLILLFNKRTGQTYALVIPSDVLVEVIGTLGSGSLEGKS